MSTMVYELYDGKINLGSACGFLFACMVLVPTLPQNANAIDIRKYYMKSILILFM